ncbi:hypothetical protein HanHA300_Chr08g0290381 [Helianthus annuus]|nr:hypothetical protein HanHA300_Chr08g0290381 [Helianthus annuus]
MASKADEPSSSAQTNADALYCKWGLASYNNLIHDYGIWAEWNPVLSSKTDTAFPLKKGKITLFSDFFKFCNFRLPITNFCKLVLDHYPIHISQLHPLGLINSVNSSLPVTPYGIFPNSLFLGLFFILVWKSPLFTFDRRDPEVSCLRDIPTSSKDKDWKKKFFYIDSGVIPGEMYWKEMGPKEKVKDDGPPEDAYVANALYTKLCGRPFECTVIPEGALVMAGMSLLWRDIKLYPSFRWNDEGTHIFCQSYILLTMCEITCMYIAEEWSLFDFFDPPRHTALRAADRVLEEQEPDVLKVHLEQFLLPAVSADPAVYISQPPHSGGSSVAVLEKKPTRIKVTGRKYMAAGVATSFTGGTASARGATPAATELTSSTHVSKKRKTFTVPTLTAFEAMQAAYAPPLGMYYRRGSS